MSESERQLDEPQEMTCGRRIDDQHIEFLRLLDDVEHGHQLIQPGWRTIPE